MYKRYTRLRQSSPAAHAQAQRLDDTFTWLATRFWLLAALLLGAAIATQLLPRPTPKAQAYAARLALPRFASPDAAARNLPPRSRAVAPVAPLTPFVRPKSAPVTHVTTGALGGMRSRPGQSALHDTVHL